ncbi:MAG: AAA family ATPase [Planctomycetaceae bacterium]
MAKAIASSLHCDYTRLQCTPDMLPSDILGTSIFFPDAVSSNSARGRSSPTCCLPTKSTARHREHKARCWKR